MWKHPSSLCVRKSIDPFHGDPMGTASFDHMVMRSFLAFFASVFTVDVHDTPGVDQQTSVVSTDIVDSDWVDDTKFWPQFRRTCKCFQSWTAFEHTNQRASSDVTCLSDMPTLEA